MYFKMIISRALFVFNGIVKGKAQLESVYFLSDEMMHMHNDLLVVKQDDSVDFFLSGEERLSEITDEQFRCLAAAVRFFGHIPESNGTLPMWFGAGSISMSKPHHPLPMAA